MNKADIRLATVDGLYRSVRKVIEQGRKVVSIAANAVLVQQNWSIGKLIVEDEQKELLLTPLTENPKSLVPADFIKNPAVGGQIG